MHQSKLESLLETTMNMVSGFLISWLVWTWVISPLILAGYLEAGPAGDAFIITSIFTITSMSRTYIWRRFFNAGVHKAAKVMAIKYLKVSNEN